MLVARGSRGLHMGTRLPCGSLRHLVCDAGFDQTAPSFPSTHQDTPLTLAESFDWDAAWRLLHAGADSNAADEKDGCTVLMVASCIGHTEFAKALLERGATLSQQDKEWYAA